MSAREIYEKDIRQLPVLDRLRLASLILEDLTASGTADFNVRDDWGEDDVADLTAFTIQNASHSASADGASA